MNKSLNSILAFAASTAFLFAFVFEGKTDLGANYQANRALLESRVVDAQTVRGEVNRSAVESNMNAIGQYTGTLNAEYRVYGCDMENPCR